MEYDFLNGFTKRMHKVSMYSVINKNFIYKTGIKSYGFDTYDEVSNIVFSVFLFILDKSLKEEDCFIDDIALYIEDINAEYFKKDIPHDKYIDMAKEILITIMCNDGEDMSFKSYNFEKKEYELKTISFIESRAVYINDRRHDSYHLTSEGYDFILGTLEIEDNMKMNIHDYIFKLHLERKDYKKASEEIKQIFALSKQRAELLLAAMRRVKENIEDFTPSEYENIINENFSTLHEQKRKYDGYRDMIIEKERDLRESTFRLEDVDIEKLKQLKFIGAQLNRIIAEQQRILKYHYEFKKVYEEALCDMPLMTVIKRTDLKKSIVTPIFEDPCLIKGLDEILSPLFFKQIKKSYSLLKAFEPQTIYKEDTKDQTSSTVDNTASSKEQEERIKAEIEFKNKQYSLCVEEILKSIDNSSKEIISLEYMYENCSKNRLIPSISVFREVMIELIKTQKILVQPLLKEYKSSTIIATDVFQLNLVVAEVIVRNNLFKNVKQIIIKKDASGKCISIENDKEIGENADLFKSLVCSNVFFEKER